MRFIGKFELRPISFRPDVDEQYRRGRRLLETIKRSDKPLEIMERQGRKVDWNALRKLRNNSNLDGIVSMPRKDDLTIGVYGKSGYLPLVTTPQKEVKTKEVKAPKFGIFDPRPYMETKTVKDYMAEYLARAGMTDSSAMSTYDRLSALYDSLTNDDNEFKYEIDEISYKPSFEPTRQQNYLRSIRR